MFRSHRLSGLRRSANHHPARVHPAGWRSNQTAAGPRAAPMHLRRTRETQWSGTTNGGYWHHCQTSGRSCEPRGSRMPLREVRGFLWAPAIERHTKLILTWHVGKRTPTDTLLRWLNGSRKIPGPARVLLRMWLDEARMARALIAGLR